MASIKLLIDNERNCVILAEVGNDFVDILRSFLTFPLGNIARLVTKHQIFQPGCLTNLYNSVENLSPNNFRTDYCKGMLLYPRSVHEEDKSMNLKLNMVVTEPMKHYRCSYCIPADMPDSFLSYSQTSICSCGNSMDTEICFEGEERDAVKDGTTGVLYKVGTNFFITDDLRVMRGLPGGLVSFLLNFGIKNVDQIEEKDLDTIFPNAKEKSSEKGVLLPTFYSCPNELPDIRSREPPTYYFYSRKSRRNNILYFLTSNEERGEPLKLLDPKSPEPSTTNSSGYVEKDSLFVVTDDLVV